MWPLVALSSRLLARRWCCFLGDVDFAKRHVYHSTSVGRTENARSSEAAAARTEEGQPRLVPRRTRRFHAAGLVDRTLMPALGSIADTDRGPPAGSTPTARTI